MADSNFHWRWRRSRLGCFALTEGRGDLTSGRARAVQAEQGKGDLGRPFGARWRFPQGEHSLVTGPAAFRGGQVRFLRNEPQSEKSTAKADFQNSANSFIARNRSLDWGKVAFSRSG